MFFCHGIQKMRSDGLTQRPPVTLSSAKHKQNFHPRQRQMPACRHSASNYLHLPALVCTCLHQVLTILQQRADTVQTILHATYTVVLLDNQSTYGKKCRVQTVLQKTVSVGFFTGIYTSAHPHICEYNAHHMHNPLRRQSICTPTHLRAQHTHTLS